MSLFGHRRLPAVVEVNGVQIQSAVQAFPLAIVYGSPRMYCNIIYANGFHAVKVKSGGKGILTSGKATGQILYYATLIAAIGEGPIQNIIAIWYDTNIAFNLNNIFIVSPSSPTGKSGNPHTIPVNAQFFQGGPVQEPWSYIETHWPNDARGYKDTCYIGLPDMQLDSTGTPPQMNFMPRGNFASTCPLNSTTLSGTYTNNNGQFQTSINVSYIDADPAECIFDFLTNPVYGAGFPSNLIDPGIFSNTPACFDSSIGDASLQTYCQAVGFGWSLALVSSEAASSVLDRLCQNLVVAIVWTGETLKFIPYYSIFSGANPGWGGDNPLGIGQKFYNPIVTPILNLTEDHILQAANPEEEPVTIDRVDAADVHNYFRVGFKDRSNQFNDNIAEDSDEASIERFGPRVDRSAVADEFSLMAYAQSSATMRLRRSMSIRRHVTFRVPPEFSFFDPMDIISITSGQLNQFNIRIVSIEEDDTGACTIVGEEFTADATAPTAFAGSPTTPPFIFQTNIPVGDVNPPVIFEPTQQALQAQGQSQPTIVIGVCGDQGTFNPNWGGCTVWTSLDNATYVTATDIFGNSVMEGPSVMGVLTNSLPAYGGTNPDNTNTLSVNLTESDGELVSTTSAIAATGQTLCAIQDTDGCVELVGYTTATLTGVNTYNLTGLYRGMFGTKALSHLSGAKFLFLFGGSVFEAPLPAQYIGKTIYVKFTSFNTYNSGEQDLSAVAVYTFVPQGAGTNFAGNPILTSLQAGQPVDLNLVANGTPALDLNTGGSTHCAPTVFTVDLNII